MRKDAQPPTRSIYRPRNPRVSPLYQCVRRHSDELDAAGLVQRTVETEVLERFLACGDLHKGFARQGRRASKVHARLRRVTGG